MLTTNFGLKSPSTGQILISIIIISSPVTDLEWGEGSKNLRFPDFMTTTQDGGKIVSLTHRSALPPGNAPGTHFC